MADLLPTPRDERGRCKALPPALAANIWKPGMPSPNPTGKGGLYQECLKIARQKTPEAVRRLAELMASEDERVAAVACNSILDRAWGKPKDYDPKAEEKDPLRFDPSKLSERQLAQVKQAMLLIMQAVASEA